MIFEKQAISWISARVDNHDDLCVFFASLCYLTQGSVAYSDPEPNTLLLKIGT